MFELTDKNSLKKAIAIVKHLRAKTNPRSFRTKAKIQDPQYIPVYLFGNKSGECLLFGRRWILALVCWGILDMDGMGGRWIGGVTIVSP